MSKKKREWNCKKKKKSFLKLLKGVALKGGHKKAGTKKKGGQSKVGIKRRALKGGH